MQLDTITKYPYLHSGEMYKSGDPELCREQRLCLDAMDEFNATKSCELEKRAELLKKMFREVGPDCFVEAPVRLNFGGNHISLGRNVYINFDFCAVDDTFINIGDYTMIGPRVIIATALHPENAQMRCEAYQFNKPVNIGKRCWIGANVTICPGVTIGDDVIIGAGSVVTRDIPSGKLAFGTPCRAIRDLRPEEYPKQ